MSNILFLTSVYSKEDKGNLNVDLVDEFLANGHNVDVVTPVERKYQQKTNICIDNSLQIIKFKCLNFRGSVNLFEKGLSTLLLGLQYKYILKKYLSGKNYDIAIYTTLPITYTPIIKELKKNGTCCYLLHKDFFPQSALDLNILEKGSFSYKIFRLIEKSLYKESDYIGVMSQKNIDFLLSDNGYLNASKIEICPNSIKPLSLDAVNNMKAERDNTRKQYNIPLDSVVYVYGGNISRAQGIDYILDIVNKFKNQNNSYLLFVGAGNEFSKLECVIKNTGSNNVRIIGYLPKNMFDILIAACDVGLVFLDNRFTIANVPSRMLAHMNMAQPILAATDNYTDCKDIILQNQFGLWNRSDDVDDFLNNMEIMTKDDKLRKTLGQNARNYLENEWDTKKTYSIIMKHLNRS